MPVIDPGSARAAAFGVAALGERDSRAILRSADGGATSRDAAAYHQHITYNFLNLAKAQRIRPFRQA
jgi:hypothetical protein